MHEERLIDSLKSHPINERIYGDLFDHELIKSIEDYGFKGAIEITKDDVIISGHRRYNACQELGFETIPVTVIDIEDPDELINYLIRMNQSQRVRSNSQIAAEFEVLKEIEERRAAERQAEAGGDKQSKKYKKSNSLVENFPQAIESENNGKSRDAAAEKLNAGWSGKTAENALKVKTYADKVRSDDPETADRLIELLNNKSVNAAFTELKKIKKAIVQAKEAEIKAEETKKQEEEMANVITTPEPEPVIKKKESAPVQEITPKTEPEKKENTVVPLAQESTVKFAPLPVKPPIKKSKFNKTNENIEWAKWSWNPVTGCLHDCQYCYARDLAVRYNKGDFSPTFHEDRLNAPEFTNIPQKRINEPGIHNVFVCSMADLYGKWVTPEWIQTVIDICKIQQQWTYLMLTKNPERYLEFEFPGNCWLGASATNQVQFDRAIKSFYQLKTSCIKFLSCEPLNEEIKIRTNENNNNNEIECIDWMIIGGRSESMRMPAFQPKWEWVQHLIASADNAKVPIYFKPNLTVRPKFYPKER